MNKLHRLERLIYNHRFRSQVESRVAKRFQRKSADYAWLMGAVDEVIDTHDCKKRRNGDFKQRHEFAILVIALVYCPDESVEFYRACVKHDMTEDYRDVWPISRVRREDGYEVAHLVWPVTAPQKLPGECAELYDQRKFSKVASGGPRTMRLKIIDRITNLHTLPKSGSLEKQLSYIKESRSYVLPWVYELNFMVEEFCGMLQKHETRVDRQLKRRKKR